MQDIIFISRCGGVTFKKLFLSQRQQQVRTVCSGYSQQQSDVACIKPETTTAITSASELKQDDVIKLNVTRQKQQFTRQHEIYTVHQMHSVYTILVFVAVF